MRRTARHASNTDQPARSYNARRYATPLVLGLLALASLTSTSAYASDTFIKPTAEELAMTSLPGYPGAPAVILFREQITQDDFHDVLHYDRIKILTEEGKRYANVQLGFVSSNGETGFADDTTLGEIVGRTIHADGTVIPFTGKPYLKVLEKFGGIKVQQKIFTLPDVEVGSIIEYRYATRYNDHVYQAPNWFIQDDLYLKQGHFLWYPTIKEIVNEDQKPINSITWFPILPDGAKVVRTEALGPSGRSSQAFEVKVKDVPPRLREEFMPPLGSFSYSVRFNFTPYRTVDEYWVTEGKRWSKRVNNFAATNKALTDATEKITAGASTPDEKLHRIYAAVMALENTRFTRDRDQREDKAAGMGKVSAAADVIAHGRGTPTELTELFISMARAAGFPAYAMLVPDRDKDLFTPNWLNFNQFDDVIAIVTIDGKEQFFDPGSRYCGFGQLAWQHTFENGLRQTASGTEIARTMGDPYKSNRTTRVANLTLGEQGDITGKVDLTFFGSPAVYWRQAALRGDEENLRKQLRESLEEMVPRSLQVEVAGIQGITDYDKPLVVNYKVSGTLGNAMGKRVMLPADVFLANHSATFPHDKRETAVYFHYPRMMQDAVRVNLPHNLSVEAVPTAAKLQIPSAAAYDMTVTAASNNITTRRNFIFGDILVLPKDYGNLRAFYSQLESKDQESVVLKGAPAETATSASQSGTN